MQKNLIGIVLLSMATAQDCDNACGDNTICIFGMCESNCNILSSCCSPHETPGCEPAYADDCVCDFDPYCCETAWDTQCIQEASSRCSLVCSGFNPIQAFWILTSLEDPVSGDNNCPVEAAGGFSDRWACGTEDYLDLTLANNYVEDISAIPDLDEGSYWLGPNADIIVFRENAASASHARAYGVTMMTDELNISKTSYEGGNGSYIGVTMSMIFTRGEGQASGLLLPQNPYPERFYGDWELYEMVIDGVVSECPYDSGTEHWICRDGDGLLLNPDGTFLDRLAALPGVVSGGWFVSPTGDTIVFTDPKTPTSAARVYGVEFFELDNVVVFSKSVFIPGTTEQYLYQMRFRVGRV